MCWRHGRNHDRRGMEQFTRSEVLKKHGAGCAFATYSPGGRRLKNPRACLMLWRTQDGRYLFWFHHNSVPRTGGPARNVSWLTGGIERNGFIYWSQPEPVCYQPDRRRGASYPYLIEWQGRYFISATNKSEARIFEVDPALLEGFWHQSEVRTIAPAASPSICPPA
jgi:hypothetical protein